MRGISIFKIFLVVFIHLILFTINIFISFALTLHEKSLIA